MTVLRCITWAREQRLARELPGPHGDALQTLSTYANADGECGASAKTIGRIIGYCRQEAQGLLTDLERMGLLHPAERRGRATIRRLRMDAPSPDQMQLDGAAAVAVASDLVVGPRRRQRAARSMSGSKASMSASGVSDVGSLGATQSIKSLEEEPPSPPLGSRLRDRGSYAVALREWSLRLMPGAGEEELALVREAVAMIRWRDRMGPSGPGAQPVSRSEIVEFIRSRRPDLLSGDEQHSLALSATTTIEEEGPRVAH